MQKHFAVGELVPVGPMQGLGSRAVLMIAALVLMAQQGAANSDNIQLQAETDPVLVGPEYATVDRNYASPEAALKTVRSLARRSSANTVSAAAEDTAVSQLDAALYGQWTTLAYPTTVRAIHLSLLHTGKVLFMAGSGNQLWDFEAGSFKAELWTPETGALTPVPPPWDMFCAGHVADRNGNILVMGGTTSYQRNGEIWRGSNKSYAFNAETEMWEVRPSMAKGRWYPTAIMDPAGKVMVFAGRDETGVNTGLPEVYDDVSNNWSFLPARMFPTYPGLLWTMKDKIFFSGAATGKSGTYSGLFSPWTGTYRRLTSGVSLGPRNAAATVFVGDARDQLAWLAGGGFPATDTTVLTDLKAEYPVPAAGPRLPTPKAYVSAVNLPDLRVFETGGGTARKSPVYEASILDPASMTIQPVAPPAVGRTYHSSAILLPDASVATFGGDYGGKQFELKIEIYKPDYFFKGPRPEITEAPTEVTYGGTYFVAAHATDASLTQAVLVRPASTTHSTDANQRTVLLQFDGTSGGAVVTLPESGNIAPPGWYMLFVNDSLGRPSVARWVHLS